MNKTRRIFAWTLGLGIVASSAVLAAGREAVLGADGEIYQVRTGLYGELFPGGKETNKSHPVIAFDVTKPGTPLQRILVPDTAGADIESTPALLFEDDSETVFLLWVREINIHPVLELAWFDGDRWSKAVRITGNPFALKTAPQFTITRDAYEEPEPDGATVTRHRTILHLLWQEENAGGQIATFYTPIVINDGVYIGWNPVYNLDEFLPEPSLAAVTGDIQESLLRAPVIQSGRDERTIIVAYTSEVRGQVITVEIDVLPEQLIRLADKARSHIIDIGRNLFPVDLQSLGEKARSHIIDIGVAFHPEVVRSIAEHVKAQILAGGADNLSALGEKARSHIIDIGAKLSGRGLRTPNGGDSPAKIVDIRDTLVPQPPREGESTYLLQVRLASSWPVTYVGPGAVKLFVSQSGEDTIISWAQADKLLYRNSQQGGWSDPKELRFSNNLNLTKAYEILEQRVRNR